MENEAYDDEAETIIEDRKFIVFESALMLLFRICLCCKSMNTKVLTFVRGTFLRVQQKCNDCGKTREWNSQPFVRNIPMGNLLLSSAILFSGSLPAKSLRVLEIIRCATITTRTFFSHQRHFLHLSVASVWKRRQSKLLADIREREEGLIVAGDGRADSPGHSAKFGTYSLVDVVSGNVVYLELVQVGTL